MSVNPDFVYIKCFYLVFTEPTLKSAKKRARRSPTCEPVCLLSHRKRLVSTVFIDAVIYYFLDDLQQAIKTAWRSNMIGQSSQSDPNKNKITSGRALESANFQEDSAYRRDGTLLVSISRFVPVSK